MPRDDIQPFTSARGGTVTVRVAGMTAAQTFERGELVGVVDGGTVTEFPQDTTEALVADVDSGRTVGISAHGPGANNLHPRTGAAYATNDEIAFWPFDEGNLFITDNFLAAGAGALATPAVTDIGETYQLSYATAGTPDIGWGVEQTAGVDGTDILAIIVDVLDANKSPIRRSGGTGVYVVFEGRSAL